MKRVVILVMFVASVASMALTLSSCATRNSGRPEFSIVDNFRIITGERGGFELDYRFEYLSGYRDERVMREIQAAQLTDFFGAEFVRTDPLESARAFEEAVVKTYGWDGFMKIRSWADVLHDRVVTFTIERSEYTGGAHGMETVEYSNYDLRSGARLTLDDMFTPEGKTALADNIRRQILEDHGVADWNTLMAEDCFNAEDEIVPSENFLLSEKHITFVYNPYDIACYAAGSTKVRLELADLAGFRTEIMEY